MNEPIAFLNGKVIPVSQAALSVFDLGVVAGASATEFVRTFQHQPFQLKEHLDRFDHSLKLLKIDSVMPKGELESLCQHIVAENAKLIDTDAELGLIVFMTPGLNLTYVGRPSSSAVKTPSMCIHTFPLHFELWSEAYRAGLHLVSTSIKSHSEDVIPTLAKHRNRLHWYLADQEARSIAPDGHAILTDNEGYLTETASGNLLVLEGQMILTPDQHVLHGVSREITAKLASNLGYTVGYTRLSAEDLQKADEAFISSTPTCLLPVTRFNHRPIGLGKPGPVYQKLLGSWNQFVGLDIAAQMQKPRIA